LTRRRANHGTEYGGGPEDGVQPANYSFPIFYKISNDPLSFDSVEGLPLIAQGSRVVPKSSPFVTFDKDKGRIIVSSGTESDVYINEKYGDVNGWYGKASGERTSYTRNVQVIQDHKGNNALHIIGGGELPPSEGNRVANGVVNMADW
jgi:hypothetical protein